MVDRQSDEFFLSDELTRRFGPAEARNLAILPPRHKSVVSRISSTIYEMAYLEAERMDAIGAGQENDKKYRHDLRRREPAFNFLLDGARGSGKSSLALTLRRVLQLYTGTKRRPKENESDRQFILNNAGLNCDQSTKEERQSQVAFAPALRAKGLEFDMAHCLRLLRPDNMEPTESIMEAIFANMADELDHYVEQQNQLHSSEAKEIERAHKLKKELQQEVTRTWYYVKNYGLEALLRDSMTYDSYIESRAKEAQKSHKRMDLWSDFVFRYLEFFKSIFLVIVVDDADSSPQATSDLLTSMRMFLSHPRIICIVAGDLESMRHRLLTAAMGELREGAEILRDKESYTATSWRNIERQQVEEYLAKVFPRQGRNPIVLSQADEQWVLRDQKAERNGAEGSEKHADGGPKSRERGLADYLDEETRVRQAPFLAFYRRNKPTFDDPDGPEAQDAIWLKEPKDTEGFSDANRDQMQFPDQRRRAMENFLALWLMRNHYISRLPRPTLRQLLQLRAMLEGNRFYNENGVARSGQGAGGVEMKNVAVSIFTDPANFHVVQRIGTSGRDIPEWISQQSISSVWRGPKSIMLNRLMLAEGTPGYDYIFYRLDLELTTPSWMNQTTDLPRTLLPEPAGQQVWAPEPWETRSRRAMENHLRNTNLLGQHRSLRLRQFLFGLARVYNNPVIPANLLYYKDLAPIPQIAWRRRSEESPMTPSIGLFPARNLDETFTLRRYDRRNEYFRDIIAMFASYPLQAPIPASEFTEKQWPLAAFEHVVFSLSRMPPQAEDMTNLDTEIVYDTNSTPKASVPKIIFKEVPVNPGKRNNSRNSKVSPYTETLEIPISAVFLNTTSQRKKIKIEHEFLENIVNFMKSYGEFGWAASGDNGGSQQPQKHHIWNMIYQEQKDYQLPSVPVLVDILRKASDLSGQYADTGALSSSKLADPTLFRAISNPPFVRLENEGGQEYFSIPHDEVFRTALQWRSIYVDQFRKVFANTILDMSLTADKNGIDTVPKEQTAMLQPRLLADEVFRRVLRFHGQVGDLDKLPEPLQLARFDYQENIVRFISYVVPHYHRILNDIRRAFHATRIYESEIMVNSLISKTTRTEKRGAPVSGEEGDTAGAALFTHGRNEVYTLISIDRIRDILGLSKTAREFDNHLRESLESGNVDLTNERIFATWHLGMDKETFGAEVSSRRAPEARYQGHLFQKIILSLNSGKGAVRDYISENEIRADRVLEFIGWDEGSTPRILDGYKLPGLPAFRKKSTTKNTADAEEETENVIEEKNKTKASDKSASASKGEKQTKGSEATNAERWCFGDVEKISDYFRLGEIGERPWDSSKIQGLLDSVFSPWVPVGPQDSAAWAKVDKEAQRARQLRSLLLYFHGIGPALTSLIHLDLMGEEYWWRQGRSHHSQPGRHATFEVPMDERLTEDMAKTFKLNAKDDIVRRACITAHALDWREALEYAQWLIILYAVRLEDIFATAPAKPDGDAPVDSWADCRRNASGKVERLAFIPAPDLSIRTLGLRLYSETGGGNAENGRDRKGNFNGIIGDTLKRIQIAIRYVEDLHGLLMATTEPSPGTVATADAREDRSKD